jgi:imidazoleglycerol-phosphate dehydratase
LESIIGKSSQYFHGFDVSVKIDLYGRGNAIINTGIGFLNHMLELLSKHSSMDISIDCSGDIKVDDHHTVDEIGMNLGLAFKTALSKISSPINRYGFSSIPMDEVMSTVVIDVGAKRSSFIFDVLFASSHVGELATASIREFWNMFSQKAEVNLICKSEYGINDHHIAEGLFKCVAHAIKQSISYYEVK